MPPGTVGNSEAGHLHIGAGRVVPADRVRIDQALEDGSFYENEAFRWAMEGAKRDGTRLHLLGIVSFYSSHGSVEHLLALMEMARREGVPEVYIHGMLGRRGERPESGAIYTEQVEQRRAPGRGPGGDHHRALLVAGPRGALGPHRKDLSHAGEGQGQPVQGDSWRYLEDRLGDSSFLWLYFHGAY